MWLTNDITKVPQHLRRQFLFDAMYQRGLKSNISNLLRDNPSCPHCGSCSVTPTTAPDGGQCEYRCDDCVKYFVDDSQE